MKEKVFSAIKWFKKQPLQTKIWIIYFAFVILSLPILIFSESNSTTSRRLSDVERKNAEWSYNAKKYIDSLK